MVQPMGGYSGWAGGVALAIIATPVIVRTTEDMLRLVPGIPAGSRRRARRADVDGDHQHDLAGGVAPASSTGIILALARIAGETAPLLFTALNNNFWFKPNLMGGVANLPVMIYQFALSPYQNWHEPRLGRARS